MNKKVALSLLSATVFASMTASAFAAPKSGVYMGGDVDRYYALTDLFKLNDAGYAKFQSDLAKTKFENLIFVDHDGKGASLKEILSSTQDFEKIKRDLKQNDFEGEYAKSNLDGTNGESYDPRKDITPEPTGELKVESVSAINGTVTVTFDKEMEAAPAAADLVIKKSIDGAEAVEVTEADADIVLGADKKSVTVTVPAVEATDKEQSVVYSVSYKGSEKAAEAFKVDAKDPQVDIVKQAEEAVAAYEAAALTTVDEVAAAETLGTAAQAKVDLVTNVDVKAAFQVRVDAQKAKVEEAKAKLGEAAIEAAAETAVAAYEAAPLTSLDEVSAAEALGTDAQAKVDLVTDADKKAAFQTRIDAQKAKVEAAKAALNVLKVDSVSATSVKSFKVEFNKEVDTTKATFTVKKGNVVVNASEVAFSEDKKTATINLATKLSKGEYTITVSGLTETPFVNTVTVEDEALTKVELGDVAAVKEITNSVVTATVGYKAFNQYNEDVTVGVLDDAINWTVVGVGSNDVEVDKSKGTITFAGTFKTGDKVKITGVDADTGVVVQKEVTVGDLAAVGEVSNIALVNKVDVDKTEPDTATIGDFQLVFDAKDQYGNVLTADRFKDEMVVSSSNKLVTDVGTVTDGTGDNKGKLVLPLTKPDDNIAGNTTIRMISKLTGKSFTYNVTVKAVAALDSFSLSAPDKEVVAGETVEIPFAAVDQYGKAITSLSDLKDKVKFTFSGESDGARVVLVQDYVNKKAVLKYTAPNKAGKFFITAVTPTGKSSQLFVDVKDVAKATVVSNVKDLATTLSIGAKTDLAVKNIQVADQYGRDVKLDAAFFNTYKLVIAPSDKAADKVELSANEIAAVDGKVTLTAKAKGTEKFKVTLVKIANDEVVPGSEFEFTVAAVESADVADYQVDDIPTIFDDEDTGYTVDLKVYGVKDGKKVAIPANKITVASTDDGLSYNPATGKLDASGVTFAQGKTEAVVTLTIIIDGANGPVTISKDVTVTNVTPKLVSISPESTDTVEVANGVATVAEADVTVNALVAAFVGTDTYGEEVPLVDDQGVKTGVTISFTGAVDADKDDSLKLTNGSGSVAKIEGVEAGDTFNITVVKDGKSSSLKVVITASETPETPETPDNQG